MADEIVEDADVKAISALIAALKPLTAESRLHVLDFVVKKFAIPLQITQDPILPAGSIAPATANVQVLAPAPAPAPPRVVDIRSFANEKQPKTVNEKVALIAYYLAQLAQEGERRDYLISDDIKKYFVQAGFELPSAPAGVTLIHAKNAGYLNASERGQYTLNAVGHNLVAHKLPYSQGSVSKRRPSTSKGTQARKGKPRGTKRK
jgi:hypothetical protein